jgi:hypothetical protein
MAQENATCHMFINSALECIIRNKGKDPVIEKRKEKDGVKTAVNVCFFNFIYSVLVAHAQRLQGMAEVQELEENIEHQWKVLLPHFTTNAKCYEHSECNANMIYGLATGTRPQPCHLKGHIVFLPGQESKARGTLAKFTGLYTKIAALCKFWV